MKHKSQEKDPQVEENASAEQAEEASADSSAEETVVEEKSPQDELLEQLEKLSNESNEHKERYVRAVAELENFRKRAVREREEARRQAGVGFAEDILPVLDNFGHGLQSAEQHEGGKAFADGFRMIFNQLKSALEQNGVKEINPEGGAFDPNWHESIAQIPHEEVEEGHIIEVQRIGYQFQDRLVRPAMVVVSSGKPAEAKVSEES